jgi:sigma-E factor negative regulatory protein RseC
MNEAVTEIPMLEETGEVVAIEGRYVVIETQRRSACGHCSSGDNCGTSVLADLFSKSRGKVRLPNHLGLRVGDQAVIGINESVLLYAAVLAYMLPLLLMIAATVVASLAGFSDSIGFVMSMVGLFIGMFISNRIMRGGDYEKREIVLLRNANDHGIRMTDIHIINS